MQFEPTLVGSHVEKILSPRVFYKTVVTDSDRTGESESESDRPVEIYNST